MQRTGTRRTIRRTNERTNEQADEQALTNVSSAVHWPVRSFLSAHAEAELSRSGQFAFRGFSQRSAQTAGQSNFENLQIQKVL